MWNLRVREIKMQLKINSKSRAQTGLLDYSTEAASLFYVYPLVICCYHLSEKILQDMSVLYMYLLGTSHAHRQH